MKLNFKYMLPQFLAMLTSLTIWASLMHYSVIEVNWALWRVGIMLFFVQTLLLVRVRFVDLVILGAVFAVIPQLLLLIAFGVSSFYQWRIDMTLIQFMNLTFLGGMIFPALFSVMSDPSEQYG